MTKTDLVEKVAGATELPKSYAELLVEIALGGIVEALQRGEKVEVRGFGSFRLRERAARRGRNPKTSAGVEIPAKRIPYFKAGKELKESINGDFVAAISSSTRREL